MNKQLRLLVIEDSESDTLLLVRELRKGGLKFSWERVDNADALVTALASQEWDIIVSDYSMPSFTGLIALQLVKQSGVDIPFIIVSGKIGEETAVQLMKAGAHDYILKGNLARLAPAIEREVKEAAERQRCKQVEELLRKSEERFRIMAEAMDDIFWMTDADREKILYISPGYEHLWGGSRKELYECGSSFRNIVHSDDRQRILSVPEPVHRGCTSDREYRISHPDGSVLWIWERSYPVRDEAGEISCHVGVARDISERKEMENTQSEELRTQVFIDSLTGVANRRRFDERLSTEWLHCRRHGIPLALLMIDVDNFKSYNDNNGHLAGDSCLQKVAAILKSQMGRPHDQIARYGGDEFVCLLPGTDLNGALHKGREIIRSVRERDIRHSTSKNTPLVTVSLGVAVTVPNFDHQPIDILAAADEMLYQAKQQGRDQVCGREFSDKIGILISDFLLTNKSAHQLN